MGITGVPFGRTELSLRLSWTEFGALGHREGPEGPRVQGMPEKFDFHVFSDLQTKKKTWKWLTNMVGCWNLELKMIPNDRPRSSLGSPGDFGQAIPIFQRQIYFFLENKSQTIMENHDFRRIRIQKAGPYMGAGLLCFCPRLLTKKHRPDKRKIPVDTVL